MSDEKKSLLIMVDEDLHTDFKACCVKEKKSMTATIIEFIENYTKEEIEKDT